MNRDKQEKLLKLINDVAFEKCNDDIPKIILDYCKDSPRNKPLNKLRYKPQNLQARGSCEDPPGKVYSYFLNTSTPQEYCLNDSSTNAQSPEEIKKALPQNHS